MGLDFTAWVYDLFNPYKHYEARGIHPSGVGINRYIKPSDLNKEEINYLKAQGFMEMINLISPFTLGINKLKIDSLDYNFAFHYFLTSFGSDLTFYNYLQYKEFKMIISAHLYKNRYKLLPGMEIALVDYNLWHDKLIFNADIHIFNQPKDLYFFSTDSKFGASISTNLDIKLHSLLYLHLGLMNKTRGWVEGIVTQDRATSFYTGINFRL